TTAQEQSCANTTGVPELVYWLNARHEPVLAWRVPGKRALLSCDVFVDANEYRTLGIINRSLNGKKGVDNMKSLNFVAAAAFGFVFAILASSQLLADESRSRQPSRSPPLSLNSAALGTSELKASMGRGDAG